MTAVPTHPPLSRLPDADMQAVPAALSRAAQRAREIAAQSGTPLIINRGGKLIEQLILPTTTSPE